MLPFPVSFGNLTRSHFKYQVAEMALGLQDRENAKLHETICVCIMFACCKLRMCSTWNISHSLMLMLRRYIKVKILSNALHKGGSIQSRFSCHTHIGQTYPNEHVTCSPPGSSLAVWLNGRQSVRMCSKWLLHKSASHL